MKNNQMHNNQNILQRKHSIFPVIHVESQDQALRNAEIARKANCDGVFLINHGIGFKELLKIHRSVFKEFPDWWIGVNCLDLKPQAVFKKLSDDVAGVWVDNSMINEKSVIQREAELIREAREESGWQGLYFGGVAFKYQRYVDDVANAAQIATRYMDIVTTSGPGTGKAATIDKIKVMKRAIGDFPLAIASGITPDNVLDYLDYADCFLVATGISKNWTELDEGKLKRLAKNVRSYSVL